MMINYDPIRVSADKDAELKKAILSVLNSHYGIDNAISQENLLSTCNNLAKWQSKLSSRQLRNAIKELRDDGHLICSTSGLRDNIAGYYRPVTMDEYQRYREFHVSYAKRIFETIRAMDRSASKEFPKQMQYGLFDDVFLFAEELDKWQG